MDFEFLPWDTNQYCTKCLTPLLLMSQHLENTQSPDTLSKLERDRK